MQSSTRFDVCPLISAHQGRQNPTAEQLPCLKDHCYSPRNSSSRFDFCHLISTHQGQLDHLSEQLSCLENGILYHRARRISKANRGKRKTSFDDKRLSPLARGCEERYYTRISTTYHGRRNARRETGLLKSVLKVNHSTSIRNPRMGIHKAAKAKSAFGLRRVNKERTPFDTNHNPCCFSDKKAHGPPVVQEHRDSTKGTNTKSKMSHTSEETPRAAHNVQRVDQSDDKERCNFLQLRQVDTKTSGDLNLGSEVICSDVNQVNFEEQQNYPDVMVSSDAVNNEPNIRNDSRKRKSKLNDRCPKDHRLINEHEQGVTECKHGSALVCKKREDVVKPRKLSSLTKTYRFYKGVLHQSATEKSAHLKDQIAKENELPGASSADGWNFITKTNVLKFLRTVMMIMIITMLILWIVPMTVCIEPYVPLFIKVSDLSLIQDSFNRNLGLRHYGSTPI